MAKGRATKGKAVSDRSGFVFPMDEMVLELGTNWLVHRSETDGRYSEVAHPLNNLGKYLKGKSGDPFPVKNARPRQEINAVPEHNTQLTLFVQYNTLMNTGQVVDIGIDFNSDDFLTTDFY